MNDAYCTRCDVFGHEEGTDECLHYWKTTEVPFRDRMQKMVGKVFKLGSPAPDLWMQDGEDDVRIDVPPGTLVRLTHYTPDTPGLSAGNYWSVETLDGKLSATQIYHYELEELGVLDRLSIIEEENKDDQ